MNDDYMILVNEDGQPFIAHAGIVSNAASGVGRGVRQSHKYIMKIGEGLKARYFYTQDEIRAYQQEMARKAKGTTEQVKDKVQSTTNRMKEELRKKKEDAKDKLGFDERERAVQSREKTRKANEKEEAAKRREEAAFDEERKFFSDDSVYAKKSWDELTRGEQARAEKVFDKSDTASRARYKAENAAREARIENKKLEADLDKTLVGKAENVVNKVKDASDKVKSTADKLQSTTDRMREDLRKRKEAKEAERKANTDRENKTAEERHNESVEALHKRQEYEDSDLGKAEYKVKDAVKQAVSDALGNAKYSEYRKDDPDFDDKNYSESNRVGATDFFMFKRADGRTVILEEDMKWVLPKGYTPKGSYTSAALKRISDTDWTAKDVTNEINKNMNTRKK